MDGQAVLAELERLFKEPNPSANDVLEKIQSLSPDLSPVDSLIFLYADWKYRPMTARLLNRVVQFLGVHLETQDSTFFRNGPVDPGLLHHTIVQNNGAMFQLFLRLGVSPNGFSKDGKTPLSLAVVSQPETNVQRLEYVRTLLEHGADPLLCDSRNDSPFKRLCGMGQLHASSIDFLRSLLL